MTSKQYIVSEKIKEFIQKWYYYPDMSLLHWVFIDQNDPPSYKDNCTCKNNKEYVECLYHQRDGNYIIKRFAFNVENVNHIYPIKELFPENISHPYAGQHVYNNHIYNEYLLYNAESSSSTSYSEDSEDRKKLGEYFRNITILGPRSNSRSSSRSGSRSGSKSNSRRNSRRNSRNNSLRSSQNGSSKNSRSNSRRSSTKLIRKDSKTRKSDFEAFFPCSL